MHSRQPGNGNARGAGTTHAHQPARIVRAACAEIRLQQRELDQVELCAATADAFEFAGNRLTRVDRGGEISPFEIGEGARHRPNEEAGWIATLRASSSICRARASSAASLSATTCASAMCISEMPRRRAETRGSRSRASCAMLPRQADARRVPQRHKKRNRIVHLGRVIRADDRRPNGQAAPLSAPVLARRTTAIHVSDSGYGNGTRSGGGSDLARRLRARCAGG
jgi:hypothetical protein